MSSWTTLVPIRLDLYDAGYFGEVKWEEAVHMAWTKFKQWKKQNRISCSQPKFSAVSVSRTHCEN